MTALDPLDLSGETAVLRLSGPITFTEAVERVAAALAEVASLEFRNLLVDALGITGLAPPGIGARHEMARTWAAAAQGRVRMAVVIRKEFIDPDRFGVIAAHNFGFTTNAFENEAEARAWLEALSD
jgi:hypothetical protein